MKSPRGSIRQRGRESWELAVRINRHRVTRTIHATTREEAEDERWGIGPNVAKAVRPPRPGRPQLTVPTAEETRRILEAVKRLHRRGASHPRSWLRSPAWRGSRAQVGGGRCREGEDPHHRDDVPRGTNRAED